MLGSVFMYISPIVAPFRHVKISEHMSLKEFITQDNAFKHAVSASRLESNKRFIKAKSHAGEIVTAMLWLRKYENSQIHTKQVFQVEVWNFWRRKTNSNIV